MTISVGLRREVEQRANFCCEYCKIHQDDMLLSHEIDHILPERHRGETSLDNLCVSCFECNRYKSSDIGSYDVDTNQFAPLFHPRLHRWNDHFSLQDEVIIPLTPIGRVTEFLLRLNSEARRVRRKELILLGRYPCK